MAIGFAGSAALMATAPLGRGAASTFVRAALAISMAPAVAAASHVHVAGAADLLAAAVRGAVAGSCASLLVSAARCAGSVVDLCATASPLPAAPDIAGEGPFARIYDLAAVGAFLHVGGIASLASLVALPSHATDAIAFGPATLAAAWFRVALVLALPALFAQCAGALVSGMVARIATGANSVTIAPPVTLGLVLLGAISGAGVFGADIERLTVAAIRAAAAALR